MNINLIDNVDDAINLYAKAFSNFNPNVIQITDRPIIIRKNIDSLQNIVVILSGGGSGHEPGHAGFIGHGMLTGAVLGGIFASPPANTILESIYQIGKDNKCGVLLIVKNYTGDRINFNIAAERARKLGILVEIVIVGEDTATQSENTACGRRGLAGTVLIHKIAGAMAEKRFQLKEIKDFLNKILQPGIMGTIGISFTGSIISQKDEVNLKLSEGMYELGLGIHGEAGIKRQKFKTAELVMKEMIKHLTTSGKECVKLKKGDEIVVLVNNLGSCTHLELFLMADSVIKYLQNDFQVSICRAYCGSYLTSLQMYGISITIMKVIDKLIIDYLDFSCDAPGWNSLVYKFPAGSNSEIQRKPIFTIHKNIIDLDISINKDEELSTNDVQILVKIVISACDELINQEKNW